jgi:hypothetical protein
MKPFQSKRNILWLGGVAAALIAWFVAFVIVPHGAPVPGKEGPEVDLPRMQNVPPPSAPRMKLDDEGR